MTFFFDADDNELVGNNLGEFVTVDSDGTVHIDVAGILDRGRGFDKLQEMTRAIVDAIVYNGGDN